VEPVRNKKLAEVIAGHLEQMILEGALHPGERLAPERELSERLEVSRPSLRDALDLLVARGLLRTEPSGTYVADFLASLTNPLATLLQSNDEVVSDYLEYRLLIEGPAARMAALRATDVDRAAIRCILDELTQTHALEDPKREADCDANLHMAIYEAAHNLVVMHVMRAFSDLLRSNTFYNRSRLYLSPGTRQMLFDQHVVIAEAVIAGDAKLAEEAATTHIGFIVETLERLRSEEVRLGRALRRFGRGDIVARQA
jgi:GntR family transcriptional repressor for pyruvate dehydrogenase complex